MSDEKIIREFIPLPFELDLCTLIKNFAKYEAEIKFEGLGTHCLYEDRFDINIPVPILKFLLRSELLVNVIEVNGKYKIAPAGFAVPADLGISGTICLPDAFEQKLKEMLKATPAEIILYTYPSDYLNFQDRRVDDPEDGSPFEESVIIGDFDLQAALDSYFGYDPSEKTEGDFTIDLNHVVCKYCLSAEDEIDLRIKICEVFGCDISDIPDKIPEEYFGIVHESDAFDFD